MTPSTATTFIAVCMGLLVLELGLILGAIAFLALRVNKTVTAVQSVAYTVEDKIASFSTGWIRAFQGVGGLVTGFLGARKAGGDGARQRERETTGRY